MNILRTIVVLEALKELILTFHYRALMSLFPARRCTFSHGRSATPARRWGCTSSRRRGRTSAWRSIFHRRFDAAVGFLKFLEITQSLINCKLNLKHQGYEIKNKFPSMTTLSESSLSLILPLNKGSYHLETLGYSLRR